MTAWWLFLESVITAPGRLSAWFRWALPWGAGYHDAEWRDSRLSHWLLSLGFYYALYRIGELSLQDGRFDRVAANIATAFGGR